MKKMNVYLDNAATTKTDRISIKEMISTLNQNYGNPSSMHEKGRESSDALEKSRKIIADSIGAASEEIIFTSGATEANNLAILGVSRKIRKNNPQKNHLITTKIEHHSIINPCKALENEGFKVTYLNVDKQGFIDLKELKKTITKNTILVSIIHGNNEIGTIQDIKSISHICHEKEVLFHTDAAQSYTKTYLNVKTQSLDLVSLNAHKIHGPKGIGALYIKKGVQIEKLMFGGSQERKIRPGTENLPGIAGFSKSAEIAFKKYRENQKNMTALRDYMIKELLKTDATMLNGPVGNTRLCNNINISFLGIEGEAIMMRLDLEGVAVSTGSACSSQSLQPSHVLMAIGRNHEQAHGSLRITISKYTTKKEADYAIQKIKEVVQSLRALSPLKIPTKTRCKQ